MAERGSDKTITRRGALGGFARRALPLATAVLGVSNKAKAEPYCCVLVYSGTNCFDSGGCQYLCMMNLDRHMLCWSCTEDEYEFQCCECIYLEEDSCWNADIYNAICSCYY